MAPACATRRSGATRRGRASDSRGRPARLERLGVEHVEPKLNTLFTGYPPANKPFALAHAEATMAADLICFVDSDVAFLNAHPALLLPEGADVGLRPVDTKNIGATGLDDPAEGAYWRALYEMFSVTREVRKRPTGGGADLLGYWNSGMVVARRDRAVFRTFARNFVRAMSSGVRPSRGHAHTMEQAILSASICAQDDVRIVELPPGYSYPIHRHGRMDPATRARRLGDLHSIHYHHVFRDCTPRWWLRGLAMDTPGETAEWLVAKLREHGVASGWVGVLPHLARTGLRRLTAPTGRQVGPA